MTTISVCIADIQVLLNICRHALFPGVDVLLTCMLQFHLGQSVSSTTASMLKIAFALLTWEMTHAESYITPLPACTPLSLSVSNTPLPPSARWAYFISPNRVTSRPEIKFIKKKHFSWKEKEQNLFILLHSAPPLSSATLTTALSSQCILPIYFRLCKLVIKDSAVFYVKYIFIYKYRLLQLQFWTATMIEISM